MKRLMILAAVAMLTVTALGCANRRNQCGQAAQQVPTCGPTGGYGGGAYMGSPTGGVYTGPDGYLPTPN